MVLETNDPDTVQARYTTAGGSYFAPLLHMMRGSSSRFPAFDAVGAVRTSRASRPRPHGLGCIYSGIDRRYWTKSLFS